MGPAQTLDQRFCGCLELRYVSRRYTERETRDDVTLEGEYISVRLPFGFGKRCGPALQEKMVPGLHEIRRVALSRGNSSHFAVTIVIASLDALPQHAHRA